MKQAFALLQKMGKALMLPVSVLPVAGLLLGIGSAKFSWMPEVVSSFMADSGGAIFGSLPIIFAIAVAIGLAGNDGVAALAAVVGYAVLVASLGVMAAAFAIETKPIMGIESMDTGVFGGLLVGGVAAFMFNRYFRLQLPPYLGFFAGKRIVPIFTALAAIALAIVLGVVWPPVQGAIKTFSNWAAYGNPTASVFLYGVVERALLPFGLHHIWNVPFFFEIGSFADATGKQVTGDINRFFAGDPTAGILGGAYLFKMWGLPAAAIAMWHCARPEHSKKVGGVMLSAAFTSFLTGITEPVEFSFIFVAPVLYGLHALLAGCAQALFSVLGAKLGFTFSQGFFDFIFYYTLDTRPWLVLAIGPLYALLYYGIFRWTITRFDLKTPGREVEEATLADVQAGSADVMARQLVLAFGGRRNIKALDACITRLRVELHDPGRASEVRLKALGASGVVLVGSNVQAVFGPRSENLKTDMEIYLQSAGAEADPADDAMPPAPGRLSVSGLEPTAPREPQLAGRSRAFVAALGGPANITAIDACALTRLRVVVADEGRVDEGGLRQAGVEALVRLPGDVLHLIVGPSADQYVTEMRAELQRSTG